jgi:sulfur-oxidizing protein SoxY
MALYKGLSLLVAALATLVFAGGASVYAADNTDEDVWPILQRDVFNSREIIDGSPAVALEAPDRAEDAALTPLTVRIPSEFAPAATRLTLLIDKNPSPVVAEFTFGPAAGAGERMISTRVRVDSYSNVRAVVETADGKLHMAKKFVKAAGGCSAPALKDADAVLAEIGKMQVKSIGAAASGGDMREALVMIKHPQYSGLQKDQVTGYWIIAKYITAMDVKRGGELIFKMTGGISISEDPNIRFTYAGSDGDVLEVTATDTDERIMKGSSVPKGS